MTQSQCGAMEAGSIIDGLPNICGHEESVVPDGATAPPPVFTPGADVDLARVRSAFALALHMHQPTIPAGAGDLGTAPLIGHLQHMLEHPDNGDNHNAPVFARCYTRIADFVRNLSDAGHSPRIMLDYSGNLLWGLEQMGRGDILDNLRSITCDTRYNRHVDWLGTMWGHAVVPSTPVPDIIRHIVAWRHHFASIFGLHALQRVRGFSPPEMHLPNDPDVAHAFVDALIKSGYTWILVQEHSVERPDGSAVRHRHLPHRLVARDSSGHELSIAALVKTQGSDTKLVAQMQPLAEAQTLDCMMLGEVSVPPLVTQIGDGENGGVMMNEFPAAYNSAMAALPREGVTVLNGTEYLELVAAAGAKPADYPVIQPVFQHRLWQQYTGGGRAELDRVIEKLESQDRRFHMDGGSWTNNLSWVRGYENVLTPMQRFSARFDQLVRQRRPDPRSHAYRNALLHLLCSQTSCFRYWGQGGWTEYAIEICRRGSAILDHDF